MSVFPKALSWFLLLCLVLVCSRDVADVVCCYVFTFLRLRLYCYFATLLLHIHILLIICILQHYTIKIWNRPKNKGPNFLFLAWHCTHFYGLFLFSSIFGKWNEPYRQELYEETSTTLKQKYQKVCVILWQRLVVLVWLPLLLNSLLGLWKGTRTGI